MAKKKVSEDLNKESRRDMILQLIAAHDVGTQKELAEELAVNGFQVAQATLSRDIRELHLVKNAREDGSYAYRIAGNSDNSGASAQFYNLFEVSVTRIDRAMNQVVIHTHIGMAQAVCAALDGLCFDEIIGTIAGEDTILIITLNEEKAMSLSEKLRKL